MSRIQNILDKAEREGAVRRMRPVGDGAAAAVATVETPAFVSAPLDAPDAIPEATTVASPSAVAARVVTGVRLNPHLVAAMATGGIAAEQYRALRTRILHTDNGGAVNVLLVTSPGRNEGKSLTAANLGLAMAQEYQQRICIVDADMRSPHQHRLFGLSETPGLSDVLIGRASLPDALVTIEEHQISVLPAGANAVHPAELLGTTAMRRTLDTLRSRFDRIVIDVPAATPLADVGILTPLVDSVLLVVRAAVTPKPAIHDAVAAIDPAKLLGIVLNEAAA